MERLQDNSFFARLIIFRSWVDIAGSKGYIELSSSVYGLLIEDITKLKAPVSLFPCEQISKG
jgi:hypothetical protein